MHAKLDYVFEFLEDLSRNNSRAWIHERVNERRFEVVQKTMLQWVSMLLLDMQDIEDTRNVRAKDCMYRIWRDTRFGSDKTPCKTYLSFIIRAGGRRNEQRAAYYVQIGPNGQSFIGGGVYRPDAVSMHKIRTSLLEHGDNLHRILSSREFTKMFSSLERITLKTRPRGFRIDDVSPEVRDLLRHTSWIATRHLTDAEVLSKKFDTEILKTFRTLQPLNGWLNHALAS